MSDTTDITLSIDGIPPEDLHRTWDALTHVAQGFMLDGLEVSLHTYQQNDDGEWEQTLESVGPESEAT